MGVKTRIVTYISLSMTAAAIAYGTGNQLLPENMQLGNIGGVIAVAQLRASNPSATKEQLKAAFDSAPDGPSGWLALFTKKPATPKAPPNGLLGEIDNNNFDGAGGAKINAGLAKSATPKPPERMIYVANGKNFAIPDAENRILAMQIPDAVKKEILDRYHRTGILAIVAEPETEPGPERSPASQH